MSIRLQNEVNELRAELARVAKAVAELQALLTAMTRASAGKGKAA